MQRLCARPRTSDGLQRRRRFVCGRPAEAPPSKIAASMAASMELCLSCLGLFTRLGVLAYYGMILFIRMFATTVAHP